MSFLTHFFARDTRYAAELARNEPLFDQSIKRYFESCEQKAQALRRLECGESFAQVASKLKQALADETAMIIAGEGEEKGVLRDVVSLGKEFANAQKLAGLLNHAASQEKYAYTLMQQLHFLLLDQARTVRALENAPQHSDLIALLIQQLTQEQQIAEQLRKIENLTALYKSLALGERRNHEISEEEQDAAENIYEEIRQTDILQDGESQPISTKSIALLTAQCFNKLQEEVLAAVENGQLLDHPRVVYEFVNSRLFDDFVHKQIDADPVLSKRSDLNNRDRVRLFIHLFRELYNTRIEEDVL